MKVVRFYKEIILCLITKRLGICLCKVCDEF